MHTDRGVAPTPPVFGKIKEKAVHIYYAVFLYVVGWNALRVKQLTTVKITPKPGLLSKQFM